MSIWSRIERKFEEIAGEILPDEFQENLSRARAAVRDKRHAEAKALLRDLLGQREEHLESRLLLASVFLAEEEYSEALDHFERALLIDGSVPESILGKAQSLFHLQKFEAAEELFRQGLGAARGESRLLAAAYRGLGQCYLQAGQSEKAVRELRKSVAENNSDAEAVIALGTALEQSSQGSHPETRRHLERLAKAESCPPVVHLALGRLAIQSEDWTQAEEHFEAVEEEGASSLRQQALLGRAQSALGQGLAQESLDLLDSIDREYSHEAKALALRAEALTLLGEESLAMDLYEKAHDRSSNLGYAKKALALALALGERLAGVRFANLVLSEEANHPLALTARALELADAGQKDAALATLELAVEAGQSTEILPILALGEMSFADGQWEKAAKLARAALHIADNSEAAQSLLSRARSAQLGIVLNDELGWYDLARGLSRLADENLSLDRFSQRLRVALREYDHPLLVAVMGEFSAGKSSFVNAFVGQEVAPTGITPTTATINILKFGRSPGARVVYRDEKSRDIDASQLGQKLRGISDSEARSIEHVEILYPYEKLAAVNIVDTPGLNSILPEHEAVARSFLKRADAVVWLFTANQAGKSSEKKALDQIAKEGVRILAVLNKVDQLSEKERDDVLGYVRGELSERAEVCLPVSAKDSLGNPENEDWQKLLAALEERFFQRARDIKAETLSRRLETILNEAIEKEQLRVSELEGSSKLFSQEAQEIEEAALQFLEGDFSKERLLISDAGIALNRQAAEEILELVQPRRSPFGSHKAEVADRDYLLGLLESEYLKLVSGSQQRVCALLEERFMALLDEEGERQAAIKMGAERLADRVYQPCSAYLRGYLRGGYVDHFFKTRLPKLELGVDAIFTELSQAAPNLDAELSLPLAKVCSEILEEVAEERASKGRELRLQIIDSQSSLLQSLEAIEEHRQLLASKLPE